MTKVELRNRLERGWTLDQILGFKWGQECLIFKKTRFEEGNEVIYIPDTDLNDIPIYKRIHTPEKLDEIMMNCYTGDDFIKECNGDREKAEELFWYCDWQHPSSAVNEIYDD